MQKFFETLTTESGKWVANNLISADQKKKILALYKNKIADYEKADSSHKIITTISILGALLLGVGFILLVASNWDEIPKLARVLILAGATFTAYISGYYLRYQRSNYPKTGMALLFLGALLFGASVFLIAQIYNVNANAHELVMIWFLGVVPLAYSFRSAPIMALSLGILGLWLGFYMFDTLGVEQEGLNVYLVFGIALYALGLLHQQFASTKELGMPAKLLGILSTTAMVYVFTFEDVVRNMHSYLFYSYTDAPNYQPFLVVAIVALVLCTANIIVKQKQAMISTGKSSLLPEIMALVVLTALAYLFQFYPLLFASALPGIDESYYNHPNFQALFYPIIFNITLLAIIIGLIFVGYRSKKLTMVHLGLLFFTIDIVTRYFDYFYDLLPRSLFFIIGGAILIIGGLIMEKQRKRLISKMQIV